MKNSTKGKIIRYSSVVALDAGAPLAATCAYFPMWVNKGSEATVSGVFVVLALLSLIPIIKKAFGGNSTDESTENKNASRLGNVGNTLCCALGVVSDNRANACYSRRGCCK